MAVLAQRLKVFSDIQSTVSKRHDMINGEKLLGATLKTTVVMRAKHRFPVIKGKYPGNAKQSSPSVMTHKAHFQASLPPGRICPGISDKPHSGCPSCSAWARINSSIMAVLLSPRRLAIRFKNISASSDKRRWIGVFMSTMIPQCRHNINTKLNTSQQIFLGYRARSMVDTHREARLTTGAEAPRLAAGSQSVNRSDRPRPGVGPGATGTS